MKRMILIFVMLTMFVVPVYAREIPYTQDDRDRLIRVETKVEEGLKAVNQRIDGLETSLNKRIDGIDKRIDGMQQIMLGGFGVLFTMMCTLVGFVLWDRRTALAPAIRKNKELEEREDKIEKILKEYAEQEPRLAEILKAIKL